MWAKDCRVLNNYKCHGNNEELIGREHAYERVTIGSDGENYTYVGLSDYGVGYLKQSSKRCCHFWSPQHSAQVLSVLQCSSQIFFGRSEFLAFVHDHGSRSRGSQLLILFRQGIGNPEG